MWREAETAYQSFTDGASAPVPTIFDRPLLVCGEESKNLSSQLAHPDASERSTLVGNAAIAIVHVCLVYLWNRG